MSYTVCMKTSKSKKIEYKFCGFTDSELVHLHWLDRGAIACRTVTHKSFGSKKWMDDAYRLNEEIEAECIRRKLVDLNKTDE